VREAAGWNTLAPEQLHILARNTKTRPLDATPIPVQWLAGRQGTIHAALH